MRIQQQTVAEALAGLGSSVAGLPAAQVARRRAEFGANVLEPRPDEPLVRRLLLEFTHVFALMLWVAAGLAFWAEHADPGQGMALLGVAIVGVIVVNGSFTFWQEYRAERTLLALRALLPAQVRALRDGATVELAAAELVPGDVVLLQEGDRVPADCRLIESWALRVSNATLTGEALPLSRHAEAVADTELLRAANLALAGTSVVAGEARALVYATGERTEFGRLAHLTQAAEPRPSPLRAEIDRLTRLLGAVAIAVGVVFFAIGSSLGLAFWANFMFAIGVIVALVPEGLLPTVTLTLAMGAQRMARRNALVRHLPAIETLGAATVILTDKTGTLTANRMQVVDVVLDGQRRAAGRDADARAALAGHADFVAVAALSHSLKRSAGSRWLGDPMEAAFAVLAEHSGLDAAPWPKVDEIPFDASRRRMSTLHRTPDGLRLLSKGAPENLLPLCTRWRVHDAARAAMAAAQGEMAAEGLRVLAFAQRHLVDGTPREQWEQDLEFLGLVALADPLRPEVPAAVASCRAAGVRVLMVTGDHPHTALAVARRCGLVGASTDAVPRVVLGEQLEQLTPAQLQLLLDTPEIVFARLSAEHKLLLVEGFQRKREVVVVTGDGVNDGPALRRADLGIAMGRTGSDVAREAAGLVLLDDNFATIAAAIEEGRAVYENLRKFLTYILTSNIPEVVPYLAFVLLGVPLPLTVIQILAVDLGTDLLPALALGMERPTPELMQRRPRRRDERLLDTATLLRAYAVLGPLQAALAMGVYFTVLLGGGWLWGQPLASSEALYRSATAACLAAIVVAQAVNVFLCRHPWQPAWHFRPADNVLLPWAVAAELLLLLAIVYTSPGQALFGTAPVPAAAWAVALAGALAFAAIEEARKSFVRHRAA
jgi:calcium-translocating P-type ATPase